MLGIKYLGKAMPCTNALKPHEGKKGKGKKKKRDRKKRQFCQYAESATEACANPAPPFKSDLKRQSCAGRNLHTLSQKPHEDTQKGQKTHCCLNSHKNGHMHLMLPTY